MKIVFLGDIVANSGRKAVKDFLPIIKKEYSPDIIIANCENASGGLGITPKNADELFSMGINLLSSGNHIWKHPEINTYLNNNNRIIRPLNYPDKFHIPGFGFTEYKCKGFEVVLVNLLGRIFMDPVDCPFTAIDNLLEKIDPNKIIIVDFHAEASSEKIAMGWYLDGRVSAVLGTHTHVQTADNRILPNGTAYISDLGMCGPMNSVIGVEHSIIIERLISARPVKFKFSLENPGVNGVFIELDKDNKVIKFERIKYAERM